MNAYVVINMNGNEERKNPPLLIHINANISFTSCIGILIAEHESLAKVIF